MEELDEAALQDAELLGDLRVEPLVLVALGEVVDEVEFADELAVEFSCENSVRAETGSAPLLKTSPRFEEGLLAAALDGEFDLGSSLRSDWMRRSAAAMVSTCLASSSFDSVQRFCRLPSSSRAALRAAFSSSRSARRCSRWRRSSPGVPRWFSRRRRASRFRPRGRAWSRGTRGSPRGSCGGRRPRWRG